MNLRFLPILATFAFVTALSGCTVQPGVPKPPPGWKEKMAETSPSDKGVVAVVTPRLTIRTAEDWSISETAADSLARIGAPAVPSLIQMLQDSDPAMRERAAKILAGIGPDAAAAVSMLQTTAHDGDPGVRKWSIRALGQIGEAAGPAVPDVLQALREKETAPAIRVTPLPPANVPATPGPTPPLVPPPTRTPGTLM
jgi:HEAT repeat protein